jgi:nitrite transporter
MRRGARRALDERSTMYAETIDGFVKAAEKKLAAMRQAPGGFFVSSMLAGAYVGMGIILIFILGGQVPPEFQKLVMGATFGIALTLVVIAGAELFTGHTMFMALRAYRGIGTLADLGASWGMTWAGNLVGALALVALFALGGGSGILSSPDTLVMKVAAFKMNSPGAALFARAILCNWLVCLAIWMSARVNSDSAKCIVIFWCLLAFIASGFEHSVANMTLLGLALAGNHPETVSLGGFAWNLGWVTLGNAVGGAIFVAGAYYVSSYGFPVPAAAREEAKAGGESR